MSALNASAAILPQILDQRQDAVNDAIDRLQATLEDARGMPAWAAALFVVISLLCAIILLHVLALMAAGPCLWAMWRQRHLRAERLLEEDQEVEIVSALEEERQEREEREERT